MSMTENQGDQTKEKKIALAKTDLKDLPEVPPSQNGLEAQGIDGGLGRGDLPRDPSRRRWLRNAGLGVAGGALACYGLSKLKVFPRPGGKEAKSEPTLISRRTNPKNGDEISLLGFGCMRFPLLSTASDPYSSQVDEAASIRMIDRAIESGLNFFDSAYIYHGGRSEVIMGKALKRHDRSDFFISTKVPTIINPTLEQAKKIFVEQLERCQTDYFDYYLLHGVTSTQKIKQIYEANGILEYLLREKASGRVRNLGFSFHGDKECLEYLLSLAIDWDIALVQLNYHDLLREYRPPIWLTAELSAPAPPSWILERMSQTDIPLMVMEPLLGRRLAKLTRKALAVLQEDQQNASAASWAFRYVASIPKVAVVLSGMTLMEHLEDNIKTFSPLNPITPREITVLERALDYFVNPNIIPCTGCGYCMPCPYGVDIPAVFSHYNDCQDNELIPKGVRDPDYERARKAYLVGYDRSVPELRQAERCAGCDKCLPKCPQMIPVSSEIARLGQYAQGLRNSP
ncbi:MAG: aldo/keto reductase [Deltaproteobacteria bacterium]|jgi:predicted aldo/keto reductase-like oxidoreductase|nr:aldo/keto reductase [Deltaproteobacteria bacterium]